MKKNDTDRYLTILTVQAGSGPPVTFTHEKQVTVPAGWRLAPVPEDVALRLALERASKDPVLSGCGPDDLTILFWKLIRL